VPYETAFEMDPAEACAACVVFGEIGAGARRPVRFDWSTMSWGDDGD
jgi:hypothetical protein